MYHFERYMKTLKRYVNNRSRPEDCIAERYAKRTSGEGITRNEILTISRSELEQTNLYVLHNVDEAES
ncbi:hypothetical protein Lal_00007750 [Lupinus albus]|nr:hypothetical protein Lal_00007750 [Lupinus albus]